MTGTIAVGERFTTAYPNSVSRELRFGPQGLKGRVIVNALRNTSDSYWDAPVKIGYQTAGEITLNAPDYSTPSSSLGGGLVGLVPFRLYPADMLVVSASSKSPNVALRCSGNLYFDSTPVGRFFVIRHRPPNTSGAFSTSIDWGSSFGNRLGVLSGGQVVNASTGDYIRLDGSDLPPGDYLVESFNVSSGILYGAYYLKHFVLGTAYSSPNVFSGSSTGYFTITDPCPGDVNRDGVRNTADLTTFLVYFGTNVGSSGLPARCDFNGDLTINTADLTQLLLHFGETCPTSDFLMAGGPLHGSPTSDLAGVGASAAQFGMAQLANLNDGGDSGCAGTAPGITPGAGPGANQVTAAPPPVIAAMGYSSAEAYRAYLDTLSESQMATEVARLLQVIHDLGYN